jgi:hypothetical protein
MSRRDQMVSLTDWMHERRARVWRPPVDVGAVLDELLSSRRGHPGQGVHTRATKRKDGAAPVPAAPKKRPPAPVRVELNPSARSSLGEQLEAMDGRELGGCLVGHLSDDGTTLVIEDASGPGIDAYRTSVSAELQLEPWAALQDCYERNGWAGRVCGDWHTHTTRRRSPEPAGQTKLGQHGAAGRRHLAGLDSDARSRHGLAVARPAAARLDLRRLGLLPQRNRRQLRLGLGLGVGGTGRLEAPSPPRGPLPRIREKDGEPLEDMPQVRRDEASGWVPSSTGHAGRPELLVQGLSRWSEPHLA